MARRLSKPKTTTRIYYGPEGRETSLYWTVEVSRAKVPVTIRGDLLSALKGIAGGTIGCGLSNFATNKDNAPSFPHPVHLVAFTKSTAKAVDKLNRDGSPKHCVLYAHSYGEFIDMNDTGKIKKMLKDNPGFVDREYVLRIPRSPRKFVETTHSETNEGLKSPGKSFVPRGALARAVKAGRIGRGAADQLSAVAQA